MTNRFGVHFTYILMLHLGLIFGLGILKLKEKHTSQQSPGVMTVKVATHEARPTKVVPVIPHRSTSKLTPRPSIQPETQEKVSTVPAQAVEGTGNSEGRAATAKDLYISEVRSKIESNKFYPLISRRMGQTGIVVVAFTLLKDGSIMDLHVHKSSRFERLDASALDAVKKVGRFNPIPNEINQSQMDITVPLKFYL
jgi:periplasmic protein TonB